MNDVIEVHERFTCTQEELWAAIADGSQLSAWFGGECSIEPRAGGTVRFDLADDGVVATGVVRTYVPPSPERHVAHIEHTFVETERPDLASICKWSVVRHDDGNGCELVFTMDGAGEGAGGSALRDGLADVDPAETERAAVAALAAAEIVLLVDWISSEIPATVVATGKTVHARVGPADDDWAVLSPAEADPGFVVTKAPPPERVDLLYLDWTPEFEHYVEVAAGMAASTFWYHSGRTRPPAPADDRGCWVPPRQSARQRAHVEARGMAYVDAHFIVDVARELLSGP